jgi:hypothetical protein
VSDRRLPTLLLAVLLVGAATAAAVVLNLVLLGRAGAGNDPIGRLRPRLTSIPARPASPAAVLRPTHGVVENEGADD